MIYVLVDDGYYNDTSDKITAVSTSLEKILSYLSFDKMSSFTRMTDCEILIYEDGRENYIHEMAVSTTMDKSLIHYPSDLLRESKEYENIVSIVGAWCKDISNQLQEIKKAEEVKRKNEKEQRELELYERLKKKYEN